MVVTEVAVDTVPVTEVAVAVVVVTVVVVAVVAVTVVVVAVAVVVVAVVAVAVVVELVHLPQSSGHAWAIAAPIPGCTHWPALKTAHSVGSWSPLQLLIVVGVVVVAVIVVAVLVVVVSVVVVSVAVVVTHVPQSAGQVTAMVSLVTGESQNARSTSHFSASSA